MCPLNKSTLRTKVHFALILPGTKIALLDSVPVGKSRSSCTWMEIAILSLPESVLLTLLIAHLPGQVYWHGSTGNWNWVYGPLGWFGYRLTLSPAGGGVDMAPLDQEIYFVSILFLPSSVPVGKSRSSCTWTEIAILSLVVDIVLF